MLLIGGAPQLQPSSISCFPFKFHTATALMRGACATIFLKEECVCGLYNALNMFGLMVAVGLGTKASVIIHIWSSN